MNVEDPTSSTTRHSLLVRLRDPNDHQAWPEFVGVYAPLLYRWCRRRGVSDADAQDVTQAVLTGFVQVAGKFEYDPQRGRFRSYLKTALTNELARLWRAQAKRPESVSPESAALAGQPAAASDASWDEEFYAHLATTARERIRLEFDDREWQAFVRCFDEGLPADQVAAELWPDEWEAAPEKRAAIRQRVYKANFKIRTRLEAELEYLAEDIPYLG